MIENDKFMEQFMALKDSENFRSIVDDTLVNKEKPKCEQDDTKFTEGIEKFTNWFKQAYTV